jgi:ABC-type multidrug transport system fused ATPase/permease subunit
LLIAMLCLVGATAAELLAPWPLKIVVDHLLLGQDAPAWLSAAMQALGGNPTIVMSVLCGAIVLLALAAGALQLAQAALTAKVGHDIAHRVRAALFEKLSQLSVDFYNSNHSAELLTRVSTDTALMRDVFTDWSVKAVSETILVLGILAVMFVMDWRLAACVVVTLPVLFIALRTIGLRIRATARAQRRQDAQLSIRLGDSIGAMSLVQLFSREAREIARFVRESERSRDAGVSNARAAAAMSRSVSVVAAGATALTLFVGGKLAMQAVLTPGELLIFLAYVAALFKPVRDLGKLWGKLARARIGAERIEEILIAPHLAADSPDAIDAGELRGHIEIDRVCFAYGSSRPVLDDARLVIEPGEHVALIGGSGSGKSTLLRLLVRLLEPQAGRILLDGRPLQSYRRGSVRRHVGVVLQDALFVGSTIRDNICWGAPDADDARIRDAAHLAGVLEFIDALPQGLDTVVGERGCTLSGGQRQRLCLARTLIRDPAILVLDEPTSAVEPESARLIERTLTRHRRGRTTIVIGHQFASFEHFDRVIELRQANFVDVTARLRSPRLAAARCSPPSVADPVTDHA